VSAVNVRVHESNGTTSVQAIGGTRVVLFGMDVAEAAAEGLAGFAIEVDDGGGRGFLPLRNLLVFEANDVGEHPDHSSLKNPFQAFLWGHYTADPDHAYRYRVTPLHGPPDGLRPGDAVELSVRTESETSGAHSIFFNRGPSAAQAYAIRFENKSPRDVGEEAWTWLSRGLREGLLAFIARASGPGFGLRGSLYEFQYKPVLQALGAASESGADVKLVYDCIPNSKGEPVDRNRAAAEAAGIRDLMVERTNGGPISHNKFLVLLEDGEPTAVWTGSTNITEGGIFGHLNVGHAVRDAGVAADYLAYWTKLSGNPESPEMRDFNDRDLPSFDDEPPPGVLTLFSPHHGLKVLKWYAKLMDGAGNSVFLTAAFGVSEQLRAVFEEDKDYLRYLLLEKEDGTIDTISRDPDNRVAAGSFIGEGGWRQWQKEMLSHIGLTEHVHFVHTKIMLIDPLGDDPIVISGSANFSQASTSSNDENMLVIRGNQSVADVYLGEFMRSFSAYHFRGKVGVTGGTAAPNPSAPAPDPPEKLFLDPTDGWTTPYFTEGDPKQKERLLFRAPPSDG
jgi:phosphatidylserine/phosphatidylglycerophosphate/cardiolipin synthase-like enzyme